MNIIEKTLMVTSMYIGTIILLFVGTVITFTNIQVIADLMMGEYFPADIDLVFYVFYAMILAFVTMCFISYRERA